MQRKRLAYSSLDNQKPTKEQSPQQQPRTRKKKRIRNMLNENMKNAAKVYLHELKFIAKDDLYSHFKNTNLFTSQTPHINKKLQANFSKEDFKDQIADEKITNHAEIGRYLNRKKHSKDHQNPIFESYKQRYDIRSSTATQPDKKRKLETSQGNRFQNNNHRASNMQRKNIDMYFHKLRQQQRSRRKKSKKHDKSASESMDCMAKIYLSHKSALTDKKIEKQIRTSATNLCQQNKQSKIRLASEESKASSPSFNTIEGRKKFILRSIKGFFVNQKDEIISQILITNGWKPFGEHSQRYTLKWTYNQNFKDYELLRAADRGNRKMYFNHICNNKLVNKAEFFGLAQKLQQKGVDISEFIPQTFIITSQKQHFLINFNMRILLASLQKHCQYFSIKTFDKKVRQETKFEDIEDLQNFLTKMSTDNCEQQLIDPSQSDNIVANIPMIYNILVLCCYYRLLHQGLRNDVFIHKFFTLCNDNSVITSLNTFNKADLLFEEYSRFRSTQRKRNQKQHGKHFSIINGYLRAVKAFMTPSLKLIQAIFLCRQYFSIHLQEYFKGGPKNYWILKPCAGSKGCGVQLIDKVDKVNQAYQFSSNKIVQKYIEDIWTFRQEDIRNLDQLKFGKLVNKKFDIRQWVLIVPPNSYIFSSFYVRICSRQYNFDSNDPCSHLSNFSINRQNFNKLQDSVLSEEQFFQVMAAMKKQKELTKIKALIKDRIKLLTDQAILECQFIPGTFQVVGFDILLDSQLNPWIIQCNMSPACNIRTDWLKKMKIDMTIGALQIVMSSQALNLQIQAHQQYKWQHLSKCVVEKDSRSTKQVDIDTSKKFTRVTHNVLRSYKRKNLSQMEERPIFQP